MKRLLILVVFILTITSVAKAEDANDRVKAGSTSIGVFFDGGIGSTFSSSVQYFVTQGLFLKGGVSTFQSSITSNGVSEDIKSNVFAFGLGCVFRTNSSTHSGANRPLIPVSSRPPVPVQIVHLK